MYTYNHKSNKTTFPFGVTRRVSIQHRGLHKFPDQHLGETTPEQQVTDLMNQLRPLFQKNFSKHKITYGPKVGSQVKFRVVADKDFKAEVEQAARQLANSLLPMYLKFAPEKVLAKLEGYYKILRQPLPARLQTMNEHTRLSSEERAAIFPLLQELTVARIKGDSDKIGAFYSRFTDEAVFRTSSIDAGVVAHEMAHAYADQGWHDLISLMVLRGMKQTSELNEGMTTLIERIVVKDWHSKYAPKQTIPLPAYESKYTDRANEFLKQLGRDLAFEAYFGGWIDFTDNARPEQTLVIGNRKKKNWRWPWTHTITRLQWKFSSLRPPAQSPTMTGARRPGLGEGSLILPSYNFPVRGNLSHKSVRTVSIPYFNELHGIGATHTATSDFPEPNNCWSPGATGKPDWNRIILRVEASLEIPATCSGSIVATAILRDVVSGAASNWAESIRFGTSDGTTPGGTEKATRVVETNGNPLGFVEFKKTIPWNGKACTASSDLFVYVRFPSGKDVFTFVEIGFYPRVVPDKGVPVDKSLKPSIRLNPCNKIVPIRSSYVPGVLDQQYRRLPSGERKKVAERTNLLFRQETGIGRRLNPNNAHDRRLANHWLRIRDEVLTAK